MTSLPGHRFIRLELQKAINLHAEFALAYVEVLRLGEYARAAGGDGRTRMVRLVAQLIQEQGKLANDPAFRAGHMGGGHFVCLLSRGSAQRFGEAIASAWIEKQAAAAEEAGPARAKSSLPAVDLLVCLTPGKGAGNQSVGEYFEILSHLRDKAIHANRAGLYCDQRG